MVACCRPLWYRFTDVACRTALDVAERFADGEADSGDLLAARDAIRYRNHRSVSYLMRLLTEETLHFGILQLARNLILEPTGDSSARRVHVEMGQANLYREISGNPFRPASVALSRLTEEVVRLAQFTYVNRAFDCLPILGDALEDAGCTDAAILDHCRGPNPHVRGCWALDLILGKE